MGKARTIDGEKVTADRIAAAIIDRLVMLEKRLDAMKRENDRNFEAWANSMPWLTASGTLIFREVGLDGAETPGCFVVEVAVVNTRPQTEG